ncbi:polysaccharide pyruvyl transferase family protein [uncultured Cyclobacterium sp.]|uniref:polysaccharide pyruvyl transferase family protein n=1 Tax=uncultured Cyclobacterium sp. TaxID=453820 RepID=UPI0030EECE5E|tara:strand:- start:14997 stop:16118 length:1122 start_codon:yes stop_codon:yes gene_type:complete
MIVEIKGVGTTNKGAHLLLLAILQEFSRRGINAEFCASPGFGMDYFSAAKHGLKLKVTLPSSRLPWSSILGLLPKSTRNSYGLILDKDIDLVLDASGFAYGDFWGAKKPLFRLNNVIEGKVPSKAKTILLPQALGPFDKKEVKDSFHKVVDKVDLIFARDTDSLNNLKRNYGDQSKFLLAPDFTNLLEVVAAETYPEGNVCIVPNYKMIAEGQNSYFNFLKDALVHLMQENAKPYFLIHEGEKDKAIADKLNKELKIDLPIVMEEDPLMIKKRIKASQLIIVSRFHGLVSALCQGVPVIATSWSHKYKMLLQDYQKATSLVDINSYQKEELNAMIGERLALSKREYYIQQKEIIQEQKNKTTDMWDKVFDLIK